MYFGSADDRVCALNAATGALVCISSTGNSIESSPSVVNGVVCIGSEDDDVYAPDAASGALLASHLIGRDVEAGAAVSSAHCRLGRDLSLRA